MMTSDLLAVQWVKDEIRNSRGNWCSKTVRVVELMQCPLHGRLSRKVHRIHDIQPSVYSLLPKVIPCWTLHMLRIKQGGL